MKKTIFLALLVTLLAVCGLANALPSVEYVKINGDVYNDGDQLAVERGETLDIRVKLVASQEEENVEVAADILGYEYNDRVRISDSTSTFDMNENDTEYKDLEVKIPENADKAKYDLHIRVGSRRGPTYEANILLNIKGARHDIQIKDVILSPENNVQAGRALLATVRIKNYGDKDEEGIKIKVSVPGLGISASDYVDKLDEGDSTTSEELYLRIPNCAEQGRYDMTVKVEYNEGYDEDSIETSILITEGDLCKPIVTPGQPTTQPTSPQTIISVGATMQDVTIGTGGVVYPLTLTNAGSNSRTYTLSVEGADWADVRVSPSNTIVVGAGETKAAFVYVAAKPAASAGQKMFSVTVSLGQETLKQIPLSANVVAGQAVQMNWERIKRGLEIGLVILVVLLVILGLIIGFNKLKGDSGPEEKEKSYY
ncbi:MAG: FixG Ig-like domain-containing protein [Candidatus Woesearchaeota archaeon]